MPLVEVTMFAGRTDQQKVEIARLFADALVCVGNAHRDSVHVIFRDCARADWLKSSELQGRGGMSLPIRKLLAVREEIRAEAGRVGDPPLVKAAAIAVIANPYAGRLFSTDLGELTEHRLELGRLLGQTAEATLGTEVQSYGKAALVGLAGETEHAVAIKTGEFGDGIRATVGGSQWISSVIKRCAPGTPVDVPLACADEIWVRSHYDSITVLVPDAPLPDEIAVILAVASRGRLNARVGGLGRDEALGRSTP